MNVKLKVVLMITISLIFYTLTDIYIWQRIFEAKDLIAVGVGIYHIGFAIELAGFILLGMVSLLPNWKMSAVYGGSVFVLAMSGLEDILYYWLDFRAVNNILPWLDAHPLVLFSPVTAGNVIISALIWIIIVALVIYFVKEK